MMRIFCILPFLITIGVLAGCVSPNAFDERFKVATPPSAKLKKNLLAVARDILYDPGSIRDSEISHVFEAKGAHWPSGKGKAVCVKFNSKNQMGGYTGRMAHVVMLSPDEKPINYTINWPFCRNPLLKWQTFPEANGLASL